jgi:hypothetical protein
MVLRAPSAWLAVGVVWVASLAGCAPYEWQSSGRRYTAAEQGRVVHLLDISIRYTQTSAWNLYWHEWLVEPADTAGADDHLPRWTENKWFVNWHLLQEIDTRMPAYRAKSELLQAGEYSNREVGTFRQAWIVGTSPFAIAFLVPHPTTGATTFFAVAPGIDRIQTRSGGEVTVDSRKRVAQLVSEADLHTKANVVLLSPSAFSPQTALLILHEPLELGDIVQAIAEPSRLNALVEKTILIPRKIP